MNYLERLADFADVTRFDHLSERTRTAAKRVVLDTLGAIIAGSRLAENRRLAVLAAGRSGPRTATLIGHGRQAEPMLAALANGTAGVALEVDEGNRWGGGHPAIHVLPAALAVAEEQGADGARLIESLVAGYDVTSRLGAATLPRPNVHSHGTWGTAGAAVAVAKLRGGTPTELATVINLAVSMSPANSWAPCFEGATIRNLYPGRSGLQGILAVHLLRCGYTAPSDAPSDVYGAILGERFDPDAVVERLGDSYRIERNYFKFHACCLYSHPALDAVLALRSTERFTPEDVAHVSVTSIPFVTRMTDPAPAGMLAAKFSVPYAVAAAIVRGDSGVAAFTQSAEHDPGIRALARTVTVNADPAMSMRRSDHPTASVTVTLKDGRVLTRETTVVRGDAENPVSEAELREKFASLAGPVLGAAGVNEVIELVGRLETIMNIRDLTARLAPASMEAPCSIS